MTWFYTADELEALPPDTELCFCGHQPFTTEPGCMEYDCGVVKTTPVDHIDQWRASAEWWRKDREREEARRRWAQRAAFGA